MDMDCSILLATRDRSASLERTLASIAAQKAPGISWEVLVADNGSSDDTPAVLEGWAGRLPLRTATEPVPGKNRALNRVLGMARGTLLLFTDDDVVLAPGWLAAHAAAAARWPGHQIFGGIIRPRFPPDPPAWAAREPFASVLFAAYDFGGTEAPTDQLPFGPNYSLRAECLTATAFDDAVGPNGSEYAMGGETELLRRLARGGAKAVLHGQRADGVDAAPGQRAVVAGGGTGGGGGGSRLGGQRRAPSRAGGTGSVPRKVIPRYRPT